MNMKRPMTLTALIIGLVLFSLLGLGSFVGVILTYYLYFNFMLYNVFSGIFLFCVLMIVIYSLAIPYWNKPHEEYLQGRTLIILCALPFFVGTFAIIFLVVPIMLIMDMTHENEKYLVAKEQAEKANQ